MKPRTIIPRPIRDNEPVNGKVREYTLSPEELKKYDNLPIPMDSNGKLLRKRVGIVQ